jgi:hypothetical protein
MELRIKNVGWQTASKIPRRVRTAIREGKFQQAAWHARTILQAMMLKPRYLAIGTR